MSSKDVILQIYKEIVGYDMDQRKKVDLIDRVGEYNFHISEGANERVQLESLLVHLVLVGKQ